MVLRRIFGPRRDEVTGEWRRLHNEELSDLYSLPNIVRVIKSRRMRWAGHVARMGEERGVYRVLVGKPEGKRPLGRPKRRWVLFRQQKYHSTYPSKCHRYKPVHFATFPHVPLQHYFHTQETLISQTVWSDL